ncbi:MAG: SGNH/GDSL hydrolase family protein [Aridibacter sp.]
MSIKKWQRTYLVNSLALLPVSPLLYLQGQYTRWKVGRLPDAEGDVSGVFEGESETINLLAIGESTVAGIGAKTHKDALTGQFAKHLSHKTGKSVHWHALGESGITVKRTLNELVPEIPEKQFNVIVVALGANDVFTLNSPQNFRRDMSKLIKILREQNPNAEIFLANVPMVRDFLALPHPLKYILSRLAKLQHFNAIDLVANMKNVYYFDDVKRVDKDFFSDGIHPSSLGYDLWSEAMVESFLGKKSSRNDRQN